MQINYRQTNKYFWQWKRLRTQKLHHEIQQNRHSEPKTVHNHDAVPHKLQLEDILVSLPVGKVPGEVACWAEEEDDSGEDPERTVEVRIGFDFFNELPFDGDESQGDPFDDFLLADSEILFVELQAKEPHAPCLLLLGFDVRLVLGFSRGVIILDIQKVTAW